MRRAHSWRTGTSQGLSRRSLGIWTTAALAYFVAVFQRTPLGVSSFTAGRRFDLGHSELAALLIVQLVVYAAMQAPVGAVLGRLGSRRLLMTGALLMATSQLAFALTQEALVACSAVYLALPKSSPQTPDVSLDELATWAR